MEWLGASEIDKTGCIARSLTIPEEAYKPIELSIGGTIEGDVYLTDRSRLHWFLGR